MNTYSPLQFWIFAAQAQLQKINNGFELNLPALRQLLAEIRPYTLDEKAGFYQVVNLCYQKGLTVIVQPCKNIAAGILWVNQKPCIVISNPNGTYHELWFSLLHELYHVLFEYNNLIIQGYHVSYKNELLLSDNLADYFAEMMLFDPKKLNLFYQYAYKETEFVEQAIDNCIHPAILIALLLKNNPPARIKTAFVQFKSYGLKSTESLKAFFFPYWERFNIESS